MDPDRYHEILARRSGSAAQEPPVPEIEPLLAIEESTPFALELLGEAADRPLTGGELLCLFEEAALGDLTKAATLRRSESATVGWSDGTIASGPTVTEIANAARSKGRSLAVEVAAWVARGHRFLPGGDAGVLSDRVRASLWPESVNAAEWLAVLQEARLAGIPVSAGWMVGHVETAMDRVEHLLRISDFHHRRGGLAVLVIQAVDRGSAPFFAAPETWNQLESRRASAREDLLRTVAWARLALDRGVIVQLDAAGLDEETVRRAISCGADDVGFERTEVESVFRPAGSPALTAADLERIITQSGYRPRQRDDSYHPVDEA